MNVGGHSRDIVSSIGLTSNVDRTGLKLRVLFDKFGQEFIELFRNLVFIVDKISGTGFGKASTNRLVDIKDI